MKVLKAQRELAIPEGVDVTLKARKIVVKGPSGTLQRDFTHLPRIDLHHDKENSQIIATMFFSSKKRWRASGRSARTCPTCSTA